MKNLRKLRKEKGYTCESLGQVIGIQKSAMAKYERGDIQPSQEILLRLADVLNTTTDYLLGRTDNPNPVVLLQTEKIELAQEIETLSEKDRELIKHIINKMKEEQSSVTETKIS